MEREQRRLCRERRRASRAARRSRSATPNADRADHLPADEPVLQADRCGQEARGQFSIARARHGGVDRDRATRAGRRDRRIQDPRRALAAARPGETQLRDDGPSRASREQEAHGLVLTAEGARRNGLCELDAPDEILPILSDGHGLQAERLYRRDAGARPGHPDHERRGQRRHHAPGDPHQPNPPLAPRPYPIHARAAGPFLATERRPGSSVR